MPSCWLKTCVACYNRPIEFVINDSILVCVANKHLNQAKKKKIKNSSYGAVINYCQPKNPACSKNVCPKNCHPLLITFWVFKCCSARIPISVTLRQLFHWNKKSITIYNIFGGRSGIIWILIFMIPVVFLPQWFMIFFQIHDSRWLLITYSFNDVLIGYLRNGKTGN